MKALITSFLFFLIVSLFMSPDLFAASNCVFVIMGGSKNWVTLLPLEPTDISIDVDAAVKSEAKKTGCQIISMANDNEADFLNHFKKLKSITKNNKPGTTYHLAFTDHGAPYDGKGVETPLITGVGEHTSYGKFFQALKENIPAGSHVTYQTNNCWPHIAELITTSQLDSHFDMCGGSSGIAEQMSWNLHDLDEDDNGKIIGPYGAVGLHFANAWKKKYGRAPSIADFHHHSKSGDLGNLVRQPGLTTSLSFANSTLRSKKQKSPLVATDIVDLMSDINWKNDKALDQFLGNSTEEILKATESRMTGTCLINQKNPFDDFMKRISPLYSSLMNSQYDLLPAPYGAQNKEAKNWMQKNQKNLARILSGIAIEKAQFIKMNKNYPKEKYTNIEESWNLLKKKHAKSLREYVFHLRILQEGKVVQNFMKDASVSEKSRFQKLIQCESKPMF